MYLIQEMYYNQMGILTSFLVLNLQSKHKPTKMAGTMYDIMSVDPIEHTLTSENASTDSLLTPLLEQQSILAPCYAARLTDISYMQKSVWCLHINFFFFPVTSATYWA